MTNNQLPALLPQVRTHYIIAFKNCLNSKLALVEALCGSGGSLQNNPSFLLSKYSTKTFRAEFAFDPGTLTITTLQFPLLTQLFMQIYQYLDSRLATVATMLQSGFKVDVDLFHRELEDIVRNAEEKASEGVNFGELILNVNAVQHKFVARLIEKIEKKEVSIKGFVDEDDIEDVKKFIKDKIIKEQKKGITSSKPKNRQNRLNFVAKTQQSPKLRNWVVKRLPPKRQPPSPLLNLSSANPKPQKIFWRQNTPNFLQNMQQQSMELQSYVAHNYKTKLINNYGNLLNLDDSCYVKKSQVELNLELEHRNLKNKIYIDTYLCQYQRKLRKRSRRESSCRSYRSTAKTSRKIEKNQEPTIFQQKMDSMHIIGHKNSEYSRKTQNVLELPAIMTRHYRKTTAQK